MVLYERIDNSANSIRRGMEKPIKRGLEWYGFVPVETDLELARQLRIDTLRSFWALTGQEHLLKFKDDALSNYPEINDDRIEEFANQLRTGNWKKNQDVRLKGLVR